MPAGHDYILNRMGNRTILTETLVGVLDVPPGAYLENNGQVVLEAENGQIISGTTHAWLTSTAISGYTGTSYLHSLPDTDAFYPTDAITDSPKVEYLANFTTPATYTVWIRGYADNADADALNVGLDGEVIDVTGFAPETWDWASGFETLVVETSGVHTLTVWMREDGFRLDRLLLTTDTIFIPSGFGPAETEQQGTGGGPIVLLDRTIVYTYDNLYRLTHADYSTGELYEYDYDPVGNRLQQIIDGDTTEYLYDAANRLEAVDGQSYTFDANGNLLATGVMTNSWDAGNRLTEVSRQSSVVSVAYNGVGDRVGQTVGVTTTYFALDVVGLPEVIQTSEGNSYLHLPGVIVAESAGGEVRYLLSDGLGSVRQAVDATGQVVASYEFDPYGNPVDNEGGEPYGYTGEWWEDEVGLLHLRARWYWPEDGVFLSKDAWEGDELQPQSLNGWSYVEGNPTNFVDFIGFFKCDPVTGQCERGYGLCVVNGVWQGAYVNGKPCIVNPKNVQEGNAPSWPPPPPSSPPLSPLPQSPPPSSPSRCENCDPNNELATRWLINAMTGNAKSTVANEIRRYNLAGVGPINQIPILPLQAIGRYAAYETWIAMVKTGAPWDFKLKVLEATDPGFEWGGQWVKMCCGWYSYETVANVHFGYVGKAVYFTNLELLAGAGVFQWKDHHGEPGYEERIAKGEVGLYTYYDEPEDQAGIKIGIDTYNGLATVPKEFCRVFNRLAAQLKKRPY